LSAELNRLGATLREAHDLDPAVCGSQDFDNSQSAQFGNYLRGSLLRYFHAGGQLRNRTLRFDQVLNHIAVALPHVRKPGGLQTFLHQLIDPHSKELPEVGQVEGGEIDWF